MPDTTELVSAERPTIRKVSPRPQEPSARSRLLAGVDDGTENSFVVESGVQISSGGGSDGWQRACRMTGFQPGRKSL